MQINISDEARKMIIEDARRLLLALNALSLNNSVYSMIDASLSESFISDAVFQTDIFYSDGRISEEDYRAIMFVFSRLRPLDLNVEHV